MFGAVNSVFSGLAFAGVVYAIVLQREEVAMAKQEIDETRKILEAQNDLTKSQQVCQTKQIFENTFFQTLQLFVRLTSEMALSDEPANDRLGKGVFKRYLQEIISDNRPDESTIARYERFYESRAHELGHYFRVLYNLVKLVHRSEIEEKRFYTNLIRANLSDDEVLILFLNGLSVRGHENFKPLMEEYALLKNVDKTHLLYSSSENTYAPSAFE